MDAELNQFQKELLDSVREMNTERALRDAEVRPLADVSGFDADVASSTTHHHNVSLKSKNNDTSTSEVHG
ncbi:hypothetical protein KRR23_12990 [Pseudomonas sp. CVAP|uniref:hypothetical protein n=1 Tax=Pseudomonas sp. CVAP\|nr:hypothetical protein [Pseudomonas sp. CVAP\